MLLRTLFIALLALTPSLGLADRLSIVATTSSMGMLVREVGGKQIQVETLAPPDRDPHTLQARPSMIRALRNADLIVAVGAELEVGWLPAALQSAANAKILPGQPGYFEAAAQVRLIGIGQEANRALGDVHPAGNPHVNMDPVRMTEVAKALAVRLAQLNPVDAGDYQSNALRFEQGVQARMPDWRRQTHNAPGVVLYHKDTLYLWDRLEVPVLGILEPVPGVPPTANHLQGLVGKLRGKQGVILYHPYEPEHGPKTLSKALGWKALSLPLEPPIDATTKDYLALIDNYIQALGIE